MGSPMIQVASRAQTAQYGQHSLLHVPLIESHHQAVDFTTPARGSLHQAAIGVRPTALLQQRALHDHGTQFARELTQDARRFTPAPLVDPAAFFPEAKEPFDWPA